MIRTLGTVVVFALSMAVGAVAQAQSWVENTHYRTLDTPVRTASDEGVEVAEVFWYGCPHCYTFKPLIESWADQAPDYVNFVKLPAALGQSWEPHAYAFYALEAMGELDKVHDAPKLWRISLAATALMPRSFLTTTAASVFVRGFSRPRPRSAARASPVHRLCW